MLPADLMEEIASDAILDVAYCWLCHRRKDYSHNNDVWTLRLQWREIKPWLQGELIAGRYRFESMKLIPESEDHVALWCSRDSLVQKAMTLVLTRYLATLLPKTCYHLIDNGGSKAAVRDVLGQLSENVFVFRTDVKSYYGNIDHDILFGQLKQHIADTRVLNLLWQYMRRLIYDGGLYYDVKQGIPMGCPLSPLMGAIYLLPLDKRMERTKVFYARYMDDWVVLAATRRNLRAAVRIVNQTMAELRVQQHPDKTFVGRISRGFDFLGYRITPAGLVGLAAQTIHQTVESMNRLYEQGADSLRIGQYIRRWWSSVRGGIGHEFPMGDLPLVLSGPLIANGLGGPLCGLSPPADQSQTAKGQSQDGQTCRLRHDVHGSA